MIVMHTTTHSQIKVPNIECKHWLIRSYRSTDIAYTFIFIFSCVSVSCCNPVCVTVSQCSCLLHSGVMLCQITASHVVNLSFSRTHNNYTENEHIPFLYSLYLLLLDTGIRVGITYLANLVSCNICCCWQPVCILWCAHIAAFIAFFAHVETGIAWKCHISNAIFFSYF